MDGQTDRWMDRQTDGWTNRQMDGQTDRQIDRQSYRGTDRWTDINTFWAASLKLKPFDGPVEEDEENVEDKLVVLDDTLVSVLIVESELFDVIILEAKVDKVEVSEVNINEENGLIEDVLILCVFVNTVEVFGAWSVFLFVRKDDVMDGNTIVELDIAAFVDVKFSIDVDNVVTVKLVKVDIEEAFDVGIALRVPKPIILAIWLSCRN